MIYSSTATLLQRRTITKTEYLKERCKHRGLSPCLRKNRAQSSVIYVVNAMFY